MVEEIEMEAVVEAVSDACISFSLDSLYLTQAGELVLSGIHPKAQVGLLSLGGLSELTFNAMSFESPDALVGILRSFPRLRTVRFTHCILLPHHNTSRSEATAYLLPNLEALEILNTTAGVILSVFIPVPTLSTLRLQWLDDVRHIPHVEDIMRASEQSLTSVRRWLGSPGQDETIGMFLLPHHLQIPILDPGVILRTIDLSRLMELCSIELSVGKSDEAPQFILVLLSQVASSIMDVTLHLWDVSRFDETFWTTLSNILERKHFAHMQKLLIYGYGARADFIREQLPGCEARGILQFSSI